ncbi:MAG: prepilin-type N-terminal cleavage/methylation domain-containing protein [Patescibacteria group bacterium]
MKSFSTKKGFTLIELLVVVAIISLLTSIVLASLKTAKDKATIAKTLQEVQSFKKGMELYRTNNGAYYANGSGYVPYYNAPAVGGDGGLWNPFMAAVKSSVDVSKLEFFSTLAYNAHYINGAWAVANNAYAICGGVTVKPDGYLVFFLNPLVASNFKTEVGSTLTTGGWSCFLNE